MHDDLPRGADEQIWPAAAVPQRRVQDRPAGKAPRRRLRAGKFPGDLSQSLPATHPSAGPNPRRGSHRRRRHPAHRTDRRPRPRYDSGSPTGRRRLRAMPFLNIAAKNCKLFGKKLAVFPIISCFLKPPVDKMIFWRYSNL